MASATVSGYLTFPRKLSSDVSPRTSRRRQSLMAGSNEMVAVEAPALSGGRRRVEELEVELARTRPALAEDARRMGVGVVCSPAGAAR